MIISCPKCNTKYKVKDELLNPEGTKLKCSKCEHIFIFFIQKVSLYKKKGKSTKKNPYKQKK